MICRFFLFFLMLWATPTLAARHAFILGNADYQELEDLENTKSDAAAYSGAFKKLGFDIFYHEDLGLVELGDVFEAFVSRVAPGDEVTFVYSGHGWSDGNVNYIVPTDAPIRGSDSKLRRVSVALFNGHNGILDQLELSGARLMVAIIDARRNNPFELMESKNSTLRSPGLVGIQPASGTFIVFSAGVGQEALARLPQDDANQSLSVFTRTFIPHLISGIYLEDAISEAQLETAKLASSFHGHLQHPAYYDQSLGKTCLAEKCGPVTAAVTEENKAESKCGAMYDEAKGLGACYAYQAYINQCNTHKFSSFASLYLKRRCEPEEVAILRPKAPQVQVENKRVDQDLIRQCDSLTALATNDDNPFGVDPVEFTLIDTKIAVLVCKVALHAFPDELRIKYQLGRAYSAAGKHELGASLFIEAANLGYAAAQNKLGSMYEYGNGVFEDDTEAVRWYRLAAEQGNASAQTRLGVMYDIGNGIHEDNYEAVRWYRLAADEGYAPAQRLLGFMYNSGEGVGKDLATAAFWWGKASKQGNLSSRIALRKLFDDAQKAKVLQLKLSELGLYSGEIDGVFGSGSQAALDAYIHSDLAIQH